MQIKINEFESIVEILIKELKKRKGDNGSIEIKEDFYWFIPTDKIYNPYKEPDEITIGQLSEDWNSLTAVLKDEIPPVSYDFVKLAPCSRSGVPSDG